MSRARLALIIRCAKSRAGMLSADGSDSPSLCGGLSAGCSVLPLALLVALVSPVLRCMTFYILTESPPLGPYKSVPAGVRESLSLYRNPMNIVHHLRQILVYKIWLNGGLCQAFARIFA